jgi:hypothetical protein
VIQLPIVVVSVSEMVCQDWTEAVVDEQSQLALEQSSRLPEMPHDVAEGDHRT